MTPQRLPISGAPAVRAATWGLVRTEPGTIMTIVVLYGAAAVAALGPPWLVGLIVDSILVEQGASVDWLVVAVLTCAAAQMLLTRYALYAGTRFGERTLARLREQLVDDVLALPTAVVERAGGADLMTRSTADVSQVGVAVREALPEMLIAFVRVVLMVTAVFLLNPLLGLAALAGSPLLWLVTRWYLRRSRTAYLAEGAAGTEISDALMATTIGARTVAALGLEDDRIAAGDVTAARSLAARTRTLRLRCVLYGLKDVAQVLPVAVVLIVGGLLYSAHSVPLGAVVSAVLYVQQLAGPLDTLVGRAEQLQRGGAAMARLIGVADVPTGATSRGLVPTSALVELSGVRFAYRPGREVLCGIDLEVRPGERIAVVGPSGAGKTTLARLLAGIDEPTAGAVTIGGVPVAHLAPEVLRRRVMLVTQEHHVFLGSLRDNLSIAAPDASDDELMNALAVVGADWALGLSEGLHTALGPGAIALDAAQEQQLALARVILADPRVILLDEATALLNPAAARDVERSLAVVLADRTVIAFAHRLHTAHDADRVVVLDRGHVTEVGRHAALLAADGVYAGLWRAQSSV